jgi:tRNA-specific 2-thiouridylase
VDSSTAAAILVQAGHPVIGVTMRLWATLSPGGPEGSGATVSSVDDARRVCDLLRIPFYVIDLQAEFKSRVVDPFCDSYALGQTPNPCLSCNREIKFKALLTAVRELGAGRMATGHYARMALHDGEYQLLRAQDARKDQSYVLYMLGQQELAQALFPLGDYTKAQVRSMAAAFGLPTATRPESQDACFLADDDYRKFLTRQRPEVARPGPILDSGGKVIGEHRGIAFYTIGQRQGLGIFRAHPTYVVGMDAALNSIIVGPKSDLMRGELLARDVHYISGRAPQGTVPISAKIRYGAAEVAALLSPLPSRRARVAFAEPQPAITPGQGVVFYQQELVLGGGTIMAMGPTEV